MARGLHPFDRRQLYAPIACCTRRPTVTRGQTYQPSAVEFNGLSQAASFGDEFETATNYPLVRITNTATGHVFYARTHDHSTMGVATRRFRRTPTSTCRRDGDRPQQAVVVANGIQSQPVNVTVN